VKSSKDRGTPLEPPSERSLDPGRARGELERILSSQELRSAPRLSRFLSYVVERALAGDAQGLKEYAIGLEVFDRPPAFDPATDSIVRVQARRLRRRLDDYYAGDGARNSYRIEIPTGGYVPVLRPRSSPPSRRRTLLFGIAAVAVLLIVLRAAWFQPTPEENVSATDDSPPLSVPMTSFEGHERHPDLSPDGERVAFVWDGGAENNYDIYVKSVDRDALSRLTLDASPECCPAWSPDGSQVAFLRPVQAGAELIVVSAEGGAERLLVRLSHMGEKICWSPDGALIAVEDRPPGQPLGIFVVSTDTGEKRRITSAPAGESDRWPALSPDGRTLAFVRGSALFSVHTVALGADGGRTEGPTRTTDEEYSLRGLDWTPDGRHLVFGVYTEELGWRLWKIAPDAKAGLPTPSAMLGTEPSFARPPLGSGVRLVYVAMSDDMNIYRFRGPAAGVSGGPERIAGSSRSDTGPALNHQGDRLVFVSGQTGYGEVWTMRVDGSEARKMTDSGPVQVGTPSWSPDGRLIGFNGLMDESFDVYLMDAAGGAPRPFTNAPSTDGGPIWSLDGRWIYFMSDRSGRPEVWKKSASGGEAIQVTRDGGFQAMESPDGRWLYFVKSIRRPGVPETLPPDGDPGVFRMPVAGGPEERVLDEGAFGRWALSRTGLYLLSNGDSKRPPSIDYFPYEGWNRETLMTFPRGSRFGMANSLSVSLDDQRIIYAKYDYTESDLMLLEPYQ